MSVLVQPPEQSHQQENAPHRSHVGTAAKKTGLSLHLLLPTTLLFIGSAGLGFLLIYWLIVHRTQTAQAIWHDKAFILDEGVKTEGGLQAARLTGLTISSAASTVISIISPFLMGLYAFRIAYVWLVQTQKAHSGDDSGLPTPLQYGLLVEMLGATSLQSLINTGRYLFRSSSKRASASQMLTQVFVVSIAIYVVMHAVSGVDLWLHAVTATIIQPIVKPHDTTFQYSVLQNKCPPYPDPYISPEPPYPCLYQAGFWGQGLSDLIPGMLVASNSSDSLSVITLADASDLAVFVTRVIQPNVFFNATSFGARVSCHSVNHLCAHGTNAYPSNCSGFPQKFPPVQSIATDDVSSGGSAVHILSANCQDCNHIATSDILSSPEAVLPAGPVAPPSNPYSLWVQILWRSAGDVAFDLGARHSGNDAVTYYSNEATMLANCTLSFHNVTIEYINGNYTLIDQVLSNAGLADGLAGPTRLGHFNSHLVSNIQGHAFNDNNTDEVMAFLQQDLARLALGSAATIANLTGPTLSQSTQSTRIAGRYPFWPTIILLALLFLHTVMTLVIFARTLLFARADHIRLVASDSDKTVPVLELGQLRLVNPLVLVAALFQPIRPKASRAELSVKTGVLDMFEEHCKEDRLRMGLRPATKDNCLVFEVWREECRNGEQKMDGGQEDAQTPCANET